MKHCSAFLATFLLIAESLMFCAAVQRIIICPDSKANATCKSISDYVVGKGKQFADNTVLPGIHELSGVLAVAGVSNL